ncbi:MAG: hypothetical protein IPL39_08230 [Opitutaceae bacterium]|nr:hypothetical protein [Opitutaceae bacterium]
MHLRTSWSILLLLFLLSPLAAAPRPVVFATDMGSDIDDTWAFENDLARRLLGAAPAVWP